MNAQRSGQGLMSSASRCAAMETLSACVSAMDSDAADAVLRNPDILRLLFKELLMEDLCRVGAVCRQWQAVSQSDEFWASIDFSQRPIRQEQVALHFLSY